jgi:hypothetical protein
MPHALAGGLAAAVGPAAVAAIKIVEVEAKRSEGRLAPKAKKPSRMEVNIFVTRTRFRYSK